MVKDYTKNKHYNLKMFNENDIVMLFGRNEIYGNYPIIFKVKEFRPRQLLSSKGTITIIDSVIFEDHTVNNRINVSTDYLYVLKPSMSFDECFSPFNCNHKRIIYNLDNTIENTFIGLDEIQRGLSGKEKMNFFSDKLKTFFNLVD
ncbi:MAG TPA: hypothetical protein P5277_01835 [Candidatus Paceibacterota bacterium]|nr:hypothetical protein [Candidatus Paceibacterota bacterium]